MQFEAAFRIKIKCTYIKIFCVCLSLFEAEKEFVKLKVALTVIIIRFLEMDSVSIKATPENFKRCSRYYRGL